MIDYSILRKKLKLSSINGVSEELAFLTHFFHNYRRAEVKLYQDRAKDYLNQLNYLNESALKKQDHSKHPQHKLSSENKLILHTYLDKIRLKNYSIHTLKTYQNCFTIFLLYCEYTNKEVEVVSKQEIETFMLRWKNKKNPSASYQNQMINAIKFYFCNTFVRLWYGYPPDSGIIRTL